MCSLGDDNLEELENLKYMPQKERVSPSDKCNKCKEARPCVVLRSKDKYCRQCFLAGTVHKFKALLGKHKLIRPNDRVMVLHKCSHPTTALLHFIRTGLDLETHKKLRFDPIVVFIENHAHLTLEERYELLRNVEKEASRFDFKVHLTSLSQLIQGDNVESAMKTSSDKLELRENDQNILNDFLCEQPNKSKKNDYLTIILRNFMLDIAKSLNCKFIFTPELSVDVATQLLADVSLGRGSHIPLDTGFCDSRYSEVKILRPLRLFDSKELVFYNHFNNLSTISYKEPQENPYESIQALMKKFVNDLQVNYPATVTTVLKTGDKLGLSDKSNRNCTLCHAPIGDDSANLSAAESTQFSHWVSTQTPDYSLTPQERYGKVMDGFNTQTCTVYCFACRKLNNS